MFRSTVTSADGSTSEGTCDEAHALTLLRTAVRRGYRIEATQQGGAVIVRDVWSNGFIPRKHTVTLEPVTHAGRVTPTLRRDLDAITRARSPYLAGTGVRAGRIFAGLYAIPPAATARLLARGLVTVAGTPDDSRRPVAVSLAARLVMLAQDHRTGTREPRGYVRPADVGLNTVGSSKPGGRCGKVYDRSSGAWCSCRTWSMPAEDRGQARRLAHDHRQHVTAALVLALN